MDGSKKVQEKKSNDQNKGWNRYESTEIATAVLNLWGLQLRRSKAIAGDVSVTGAEWCRA